MPVSKSVTYRLVVKVKRAELQKYTNWLDSDFLYAMLIKGANIALACEADCLIFYYCNFQACFILQSPLPKCFMHKTRKLRRSYVNALTKAGIRLRV